MRNTTREQLLSTLERFGKHYPDWRFGQLISNAASWVANEAWTTVGDEQLLAAARRHLANRFGDSSPGNNYDRDPWYPVRMDLLQALRDLGPQFPDWELVTLVSRLANLAHVNIYDLEDQQLLEAARSTDPGVKWFCQYVDRLENQSTILEHREGVSYPCPCCHYLTLAERGGFEICPVCYWEDDGQDDADADTVRGGPNGSLSLSEARENYRRHGVCNLQFQGHVRPPRPDEQQIIAG